MPAKPAVIPRWFATREKRHLNFLVVPRRRTSITGTGLVRANACWATMRHQWQALLDLIWPSRYDPIASHERRIALLQAGIAILKAMAAGAMLVALSIWSAIYNFAFPVPPAAVVQRGASIPAKALALMHVSAHATWCLTMAFNCRCVGAWGHIAGRMIELPPNNSRKRTRER